jgi:hypothetical protein
MAIRKVKTQPAAADVVREVVELFIARYEKEGTELRLEHVYGLTGGRVTITFQWEDMG